MKLDPVLAAKTAEALTGLGIQVLEGVILSYKPPKTESPPEPAKQCQVCQIYQHTVLARAYITDLRPRLNPDGTVPAGLGGTIPRAQEHLFQAMEEIPQVMGFDPRIDHACLELSTIFPDIVRRLEYISNAQEWDYLCERLEHAEQVAYAIPEAVYRRDESKTEKSQEPEIVVLEPEDKELLEIIRAGRTGKSSSEEVRAKLASFLSSTGDK